MAQLGLRTTTQYAEWCCARGLRAGTDKTTDELGAEWSLACREAEDRASVHRRERNPRRLLRALSARESFPRFVHQPRFADLAARISRANLRVAEREALTQLLDTTAVRARLLVGEATFGDTSYPLLGGLIELARSHGRWIRPLETWRPRAHSPRRQIASLIRHLVARYPVPEFLDAAWLRTDADAGRYRGWYLRVALGESLRDVSAPIALTKKMLHHFLAAPPNASIEEALRTGQMRALGAGEPLVRSVLGTRLGRELDNDAFWITVIRFFIAHPELSLAQVGPIVDYLHHQRFVGDEVHDPAGDVRLPPAQPNLSMTGRTPASLLRQVERWHAELARRRAGGTIPRWATSGIAPFEMPVAGERRRPAVWRARELLSERELHSEGRVMHHCVASYAQACAAGQCAIFALECISAGDVEKHLTLEVRGTSIVQARGRYNRMPTATEQSVLAAFAKASGLRIARAVAEASI